MRKSLLFFPLMALAAAVYSCGMAKHSRAGDTAAALTGTYWKLVALKGKPFSEAALKEPHLMLKAGEHRITGNAGCNSFFGAYELGNANHIRFSQIGATKMACRNMELEQQFFEVLDSASRYSIRRDTLLLSDAQDLLLARFEAVHEK